MNKIKVGIIFGGRSGEHEVSLVSAHSIMQAIDKDKYEILPIGITKEGQWVVGADVVEALKTGDFTQLKPATFHTDPTQTGVLAMDRDHNAIESRGEQVHLMLEHLDVVFPVLHGPNGEDGTIQGLFELADIPYVGSGVLASSAAMDKLMAKTIWGNAGLPQVPYQGIRRKDWNIGSALIAEKIQTDFDLPVFVKPANLGSSVGITKVKNWDDLERAVDLACRFDRKVIVEQGLDIREIELAILGNDDELLVSVPGEVIVGGEFYDFYDKYVNGVSTTKIPADLSQDQIKEVQSLAKSSYQALDCSGFARIDFFLEGETGKFYLNEINTIPGFTSISMYPKLMEATGVPYSELIDRLIELAIERNNDKKQSQITFSSDSDWFK
ncbi:MAG: D-alanine--D-alanine ligase family protein [Candidatus Peregrinibacteria bacterium]|nr:D-alanine--D-alanine ligase family protein [Candidatus Peregrinibacteria bacterium]